MYRNLKWLIGSAVSSVVNVIGNRMASDNVDSDQDSGMEDAVPSGASEGAARHGQEDEWVRFKTRGDSHFKNQKFEKAASEYSQALKLVKGKEHEALLLAKRAAANCSLAKQLRSRPARESERSALIGSDPMVLAQLALRDACKAVELDPQCDDMAPPSFTTKAALLVAQGMAYFLLEKYSEAHASFLEGLALEPDSVEMAEGLAEAQAMLQEPALLAADSSGNNKRARVASKEADDFECILCMKLLFEPVTTPCGHTFCRTCFARAMDHNNRCPMCRTVLHVGRELPVTVTLASIIKKSFPDEYKERADEERVAAGADQGNLVLPLFVMSLMLPGERMELNIFEPRYRLMVRRCMEGNRRIGMAQLARDGRLEECACEAEIVECQPQHDGRYYIEMVGRRRVRLLDSYECDGYRMAKVAPFKDEPPAEGSEEAARLPVVVAAVEQLADQVMDRMKRMVSNQLMRARHPRLANMLEEMEERPQGQPEELSFWVGSLLTHISSSADRLMMMRITSTLQRLEQQRIVLQHSVGQSMCPAMRPAAQ